MQATSCSHPNLSLARSSPSLRLVASYSLEDCRPFRLTFTYNAGVKSAYGGIGEVNEGGRKGEKGGGGKGGPMEGKKGGVSMRKGTERIENDKEGGYVSCALFSVMKLCACISTAVLHFFIFHS